MSPSKTYFYLGGDILKICSLYLIKPDFNSIVWIDVLINIRHYWVKYFQNATWKQINKLYVTEISFSLLRLCVYIYVCVCVCVLCVCLCLYIRGKALNTLGKSWKKTCREVCFEKTFSALSWLVLLKETSIQTLICVKNDAKVRQKQSDFLNVVGNGFSEEQKLWF